VKQLAKYESQAYAMLRIMAGFMFAFHGAQKVLRVLTDMQPAVGSQLWIGGVIELIGGLAIMLRLRTRWASFICSGEMAVAYFQFHWKFQMGTAFFPGMNKGELAVHYCFVSLLFACKGAGVWGMDKAD